MLGKTRAEVAVEYDIATSTLGRWVAQQQGTAGTGSGSHRRKADPNLDDPAEMTKRIAELERENEFLKKQPPCLPRSTNPGHLSGDLPLWANKAP
ncbi:transposase [Corynebacterium cystitidis]|uniref:Transposase n=1 Tax=Corynebacterium cystitidis DSM 20524 TaxID=1121357 RepID=A0A1H9V3F9_9CORY|nr:transposase [Corynebacterium cystitidis]WJY83383.1 hypothetical protein CCYS_12480 [Corynebacterium cystitidis DSM 20524]SES15833.1 Transposase [Corynebacterium cystitidis DSM 20524]SNV62396.1 transposase IS3513 [Corynebacterium cystitidis]